MNASLVGWTDNDGRVEAVIEESASIGAARDNAVVVRTDGVSGHHARITRQEGKYFVEDTGSRNGTWVNGERVTRARLNHLDVVTLGRFADLVFLERVVSEQRAAARAAEVPAEAPAGDLEWRTRLVWSPQELQDLRAAGLMPGSSGEAAAPKSSPSPARSATPPPAPVKTKPEPAKARPEPVKPAVAAKPADQPAPAPPEPAEPRTVFSPGASFTLPSSILSGDQEPPAAERTQLRSPDSPSGSLTIPPPAELLNPSERTQFRPAGMGSDFGVPGPPAELLTPQERTEFRPAGLGSESGLKVPPAELFTQERTQLAGSAASSGATAPPSELGADSEAALSEEPPPTALPSDSILGFRDVGPPSTAPMNAPTVMPVSTGRMDTPGQAAARASSKPIRGVRLTGDYGEFELPIGESTVGRSAEATIRIDSREMSRIHTKLMVTPESVTVEDNGSANGTSVNGAAIDSARRLIDGDRLAFANYEFRVELLRLEGDR